ncbi:MAG: hypothetical protein J6T24_02490 [Clostridia bacterium]|nr:hypothetical protein [Clostridia bacterium]
MGRKGGGVICPTVGLLLGAAGALALCRVWRRHRFAILRFFRQLFAGMGRCRGTARRTAE